MKKNIILTILAVTILTLAGCAKTNNQSVPSSPAVPATNTVLNAYDAKKTSCDNIGSQREAIDADYNAAREASAQILLKERAEAEKKLLACQKPLWVGSICDAEEEARRKAMEIYQEAAAKIRGKSTSEIAPGDLEAEEAAYQAYKAAYRNYLDCYENREQKYEEYAKKNKDAEKACRDAYQQEMDAAATRHYDRINMASDARDNAMKELDEYYKKNCNKSLGETDSTGVAPGDDEATGGIGGNGMEEPCKPLETNPEIESIRSHLAQTAAEIVTIGQSIRDFEQQIATLRTNINLRNRESDRIRDRNLYFSEGHRIESNNDKNISAEKSIEELEKVKASQESYLQDLTNERQKLAIDLIKAIIRLGEENDKRLLACRNNDTAVEPEEPNTPPQPSCKPGDPGYQLRQTDGSNDTNCKKPHWHGRFCDKPDPDPSGCGWGDNPPTN